MGVSIIHIQKEQAIMKEDIKDLEKNYENYARTNLAVLTRIEMLLIQLDKNKK